MRLARTNAVIAPACARESLGMRRFPQRALCAFYLNIIDIFALIVNSQQEVV